MNILQQYYSRKSMILSILLPKYPQGGGGYHPYRLNNSRNRLVCARLTGISVF